MTALPFAAPGLRFAAVAEDLFESWKRVIRSGHYILGAELEEFERSFSERVGQAHGIGVGNGTDAITIALLALGIGPGDEVIMPSLTAHGSAVGVISTGAAPVFVEVDKTTRMLDPLAVEAAIGPATAAILLVHLYGWPGPALALRDLADSHALALIEDCAQATGTSITGRPAGSVGDASTFSFYPTKTLGCPGDGGLVAVSETAVANRARRVRSLGWDDARISSGAARNSRLDEIHAAMLLALLPSLDEQVAARREGARRYDRLLEELPIGLPADAEHAAPHLYVITSERRDDLRRYLADAGIGTGVHYPVPLHRQPAFLSPRELPVTDQLCSEVLSLPVQPEILEGADLPLLVEGLIRSWKS